MASKQPLPQPSTTSWLLLCRNSTPAFLLSMLPVLFQCITDMAHALPYIKVKICTELDD